MIKAPLSHIQFNVREENLGFYRELLAFTGWQTLYDADGMFGAGADNGESLWFAGGANDVDNDYDGRGMNHLAFAAASIADVDAAAAHLKEHNIPALFETPRHRPDFAEDETQTYYQVMFESPDRILFEIVYTGPK